MRLLLMQSEWKEKHTDNIFTVHVFFSSPDYCTDFFQSGKWLLRGTLIFVMIL